MRFQRFYVSASNPGLAAWFQADNQRCALGRMGRDAAILRKLSSERSEGICPLAAEECRQTADSSRKSRRFGTTLPVGVQQIEVAERSVLRRLRSDISAAVRI